MISDTVVMFQRAVAEARRIEQDAFMTWLAAIGEPAEQRAALWGAYCATLSATSHAINVLQAEMNHRDRLSSNVERCPECDGDLPCPYLDAKMRHGKSLRGVG